MNKINNNNKYNKKSKKKITESNDKSDNNDIIDISNINKKNIQNENIDEKCIGPCYPSNYLNYHPIYLFPVKHKSNTCPTEIGTLKCDKITPNFKEYNIFNTTGYVGNDPHLFILELYNINNVKKIVKFLEYEFDKFPLLTCKRILIAIFDKFSKNNNFPLFLFSEKFEIIFKNYYKNFKNYYKLNKKLDYFDSIKNIIFSNSHIPDIFIFFHEKFL
jgi:hypothetical protein